VAEDKINPPTVNIRQYSTERRAGCPAYQSIADQPAHLPVERCQTFTIGWFQLFFGIKPNIYPQHLKNFVFSIHEQDGTPRSPVPCELLADPSFPLAALHDNYCTLV